MNAEANYQTPSSVRCIVSHARAVCVVSCVVSVRNQADTDLAIARRVPRCEVREVLLFILIPEVSRKPPVGITRDHLSSGSRPLLRSNK